MRMPKMTGLEPHQHLVASPQRNVTQGRIGRKHVLSGQFYATPHQESVR